MSNQLQITGGAKVRSLEGVITGTSGVLGSLPINGSNGIPQLDSSGKILVSQLPNSVMEFLGVWNASTNTPYLHDGTGNAGDVYLCNVAGTVNFGSGPITFSVGDYVVYTGSVWARSSGATGTVTSVAVSESSAALTITGSPITTSGTINIGFAGTSAQYVAGDGSLITFPALTGYVPYTGATGDVNLGLHDLYTSKVWLYDNPNSAYGSMELTDGVLHFEDADGHSMVTMEDGYMTIANASTIRALLNVSVLSANRDYAFPNASGTLALTSDLSAYVPTSRTISTTSPLQGGGDLSANRTLSILQSSSTQSGYLSSTDWNTFNGKQAALSGTGFVKITGTTISYDNSTYVTTNTTQTITGAKTFNATLYGTDSEFSSSVLSPIFSVINGTKVVNLQSLATLNRDIYLPDASGTLALTSQLTSGTVTSVAMSVPTGLSVSGSPITSSGTLAVSFATGYSIPTTASQSNWDTAYTNRITSLTTTGSSGSATLVSNVLNIPTYTLSGLGGQPLSTNLTSLSGLTYASTSFVKMTAAGTFALDTNTYYLASNPSGFTSNTGTVTSVGLSSATSGVTIGSSPITTSGTITLAIATATSTQNGLLSSTDWSTFNGKANALSGTINTIAYWDSATTIASLATTTYPSLTELSYVKSVTSAIQTQLNAKQGALTLTTTGTSGAATLVGNTLNIPQYSGGGGMAIGGSITSATAGSILYAGASGVLAQDNANFYYDYTNARLALGTTTPNTFLQISNTNGNNGNGLGVSSDNVGMVQVYLSGANVNSASYTAKNYYGTLQLMQWSNAGVRIGSRIVTNSGAGHFVCTYGADVEGMRLDGSTGNLGVGTTTIGSKLQVNGNAAIGYSASTAAPTNGLAVSGNVAIGTNTSTVPLLVSSTASLVQQITSSNTGGAILYLTNTSTGGDTFRFFSTGASNGEGAGKLLIAPITGAGKFLFSGTGTLGINTTTVGSGLQVNGNVAIGYSASTAAPTNGLAVSGAVTIANSSSATYALDVTGTASRFRNTSGTIDLILDRLNTSSGAQFNLNTNGVNKWFFGLRGLADENFYFYNQTAGVNNLILNASTGAASFSNSVTSTNYITGGVSNTSSFAATGYSLTGTNAQSLLDLSGTWNTTGNPTAIKLNITNTASGSTSNLMDLQVGGSSKFLVDKTGNIKTNNGASFKVVNAYAGTPAVAGNVLELSINGTTYYVQLYTTTI